jgi:hypothetical protein
MKHRIVAGTSLAIALLVGSAIARELKSGPQVGSDNIPTFNSLNINGPGAGSKACQV